MGESCFGENMMKTSLLKMKRQSSNVLEWTCQNLIFQCTTTHTDSFMLYLKVPKISKQRKCSKPCPYSVDNNTTNKAKPPQSNLSLVNNKLLKMMMKKMFQDKEADESPFGNMGSMKYGQENQDNQDQYKFFQNMMKAMNRNKRAADDLFELGDRLTEN